MERTIRVTGKGKISVKPDTIRLLITQQYTGPSYENAVLESADKKLNLSCALGKLGFEETDLKTLSFRIETEYESYQAKDKSWKKRLAGYQYTHRMKLEFPADNDRLGRVLFAVAYCPGHPEFSIEYTVADPEAARNELLARAVADSRAKAEVLTRAAGVTLQELQTIDYSWGEIDFVSRPVRDMMPKECPPVPPNLLCDTISMDIEPDDIDVTDTVTIIWGVG